MSKKMGRRLERWGPGSAGKRPRPRKHVLARATRSLHLVYGLIVLLWMILVIVSNGW